MLTILDSKQMKSCDENTSAKHFVPSLILMERAALAVFDIINSRFNNSDKVSIFCGPGNNGGDGVALARLLHLAGFEVSVLVLGDPKKYSEQLTEQIKIANSYDVPFASSIDDLGDSDIIVDSIFGIGLSREVTGDFLTAIEYINSSDSYIISMDIPSGFSSETGNLLGAGVLADLTITFAYIKKGLLLSDCSLSCGELICKDVGIYLDGSPKGVHTRALEAADLGLRPIRPVNANKGTCGKVLVIAGSSNIYGACYLSAKAALRTGSGLVKVYTHKNNISSIQQMLPEAMFESYIDYDENKLSELLSWPDAIIIGPGIGLCDTASCILNYVLTNSNKPIVVDADAINLLSQNLELLDSARVPVILTPHLKEMERLSKVPTSKINKKMEEVALSFVKAHPSILVLKNYVTLVATSATEDYINRSGNQSLSTAGSGDVLSGIIGSLLGQGLSPEFAASLGVYIHGLAGQKASEKKGSGIILASEIIDGITEVN